MPRPQADRLNELDGTAGVAHGVTVFESRPGPRSELKKLPPATFSEEDAARLIRFFTRRGGLVLDPFAGTSSTLIAAAREGRRAVGFKLYEKWRAVAAERIRAELDGQGGDAAPVVASAYPKAYGTERGRQADRRDRPAAAPTAAPGPH